jgi:hypothetical protein
MWNSDKEESFDKQRELVLEVAETIIATPDYEFDQEDRLKYYDSLNQCFKKEMKYDLAIIEAKKYVRALYRQMSSL